MLKNIREAKYKRQVLFSHRGRFSKCVESCFYAAAFKGGAAEVIPELGGLSATYLINF